ncbi:MAG: outer membrane beta-barrel protein [Caulobacterales bacterium]
MNNLKLVLCAGIASVGLAAAGVAQADTPPAAPATPAPAPAAAPAAPSAAPFPSFGPSLSANAPPAAFDAGPLGKLTVNGFFGAEVYYQSNPSGFDADGNFNKSSQLDFTNAMVAVQKTDGPLQFYIQAGAYSLPSLGTPISKGSDTPEATYGLVPVAFLKWAPNGDFNIIGGQLPTLVGSESVFSFENMNIERGLLWNQEPVISRGLQANYSKGKWTLSASWNDGFYSGRLTSGSVLVTYAFNSADSLTFDASGNFSKIKVNTFVTPVAGNNSQIYDLSFTHSAGAWTITPYVQYTYVPTVPGFIFHSTSTWGGAVLADYKINSQWNIAGRVEYISQDHGGGVTSVLYGPGSSAYSVTITPTWQKGIFFIRGELSYTAISGITHSSTDGEFFTMGTGFGTKGDNTDQTRVMVESGILF